MNYSEDKKEASQKADRKDLNILSVERIKSLLANPDISPSQKRTLLNLLKRLK